MKKKGIFIVLLLLIHSCLFAITAVYNFEINGKSQELYLKEKMGIPDSEEFDTLELALAKSDFYRQTMINSRLFLSSDYVYELDSTNNQVIVTFKIIDSNTRLILPYPKYDSNTGFSFKVKAEEKNLFGTFGIASAGIGIERNPFETDFETKFGNYSSTLELTTEVFVWRNSRIVGKLSTYMNFAKPISSFSSDLTLESETKIGKFLFTPSVKFLNFNFVDFGKSSIVLGAGFSGMEFNLGELHFTDEVETSMIINKKDKFYVNDIVNTLSSSWQKLFISDVFSVYPHEEALDNIATVGYRITSTISSQTDFEIYSSFKNKNKFYVDFTQSATYKKNVHGVETAFTLADGQRFYPKTKQAVNYLKAGLDLEYGEINYIHKDFRYGTSLSFTSDVRKKAFGSNVTDLFDYKRFRAELTTFPLNNKFFNPSIRIVASASTSPFKFYSELGGFGYDYRLTEDPTVLISQNMRGIRDNNLTAYNISENKAFITMNANLTIKFISLGNFADTYASGFCDFTLMTRGEKALKDLEFSKLITVGFEGIGILRNHPSYPVRLSVGVNLDSLCNWLNTKQEKPEYEIFFGLYHFF